MATDLLLGTTRQAESALVDRWHLVAAVWAGVRVLEPFLQAVLTEDVLALFETDCGFYLTVGVLDAKVVVADHAGWQR